MTNFYLDATKITDFHQNATKLELSILFWILAAGKNGTTTAKCLGSLLQKWFLISKIRSPFEIIRFIDKNGSLSEEMKKNGIGCYNAKASYLLDLIASNIDLKTCNVDDLEKIKGVGPKTARCFLIHSRKDQSLAGLDVHILSFLRDKGHQVPKATPTGKKYKDLEKVFLDYVEKSGKTVAELDLMIWNCYSGRDKKQLSFLESL
jgi:thermostable 8-oxoguanine DNA glycosylase